MVSGEIALVDVPAGASSSDGNGLNPKISADGRYVLFDSDATDLPGGRLNGRTIDVFRKDMATGEVALVSQGSDGSGANGDSTADSISADGSLAVFSVERLEPGAGRRQRHGRRLRPHGRHRVRSVMVSAHPDGSGPGRPEHPGRGERRRPLRGLLLARGERGRGRDADLHSASASTAATWPGRARRGQRRPRPAPELADRRAVRHEPAAQGAPDRGQRARTTARSCRCAWRCRAASATAAASG